MIDRLPAAGVGSGCCGYIGVSPNLTFHHWRDHAEHL